MATTKVKRKPKSLKNETSGTDVETKVQVAVEPHEEVTTEPAFEKVEVIEDKALDIKILRDKQNRLCLDMKGKVRRIAGTEDAFPEVMRQIGLEITKERLI